MRQPLWIVNSSLLVAVCAALLFAFFARVKVPIVKSLHAELPSMATSNTTTSALNPASIYENDLFNTYKERPRQIIEPTQTPTLPAPPPAEPIHVPLPPQHHFLEPLPITLTGIIIRDDETLNRAIIMNEKTKQEINFRVNDEIEDARLVRILPDRIILIRSNGQQETLYLKKSPFVLPNTLLQEQWDTVIRPEKPGMYLVDPTLFIQYIPTLTAFIDALNLTTAYQHGISIGSKIGALSTGSLGSSLGLTSHDIITHINDIPATSTNDRLTIYKKISALNMGDTITVQLMRRNKPIAITYILANLPSNSTPPIQSSAESPHITKHQKLTLDSIEDQKKRDLQRRQKLAPTAQELTLKEKHAMLRKKW